jgi:hypothetical protein
LNLSRYPPKVGDGFHTDEDRFAYFLLVRGRPERSTPLRVSAIARLRTSGSMRALSLMSR